jgi:uncharacterized protein (TIGR03435 family)
MKPILGLLLAGAGLVVAQEAASFEVASIKLHPGVATFSGGGVRGATLSYTAMTLHSLIEDAYGMRPDQISGGPSWIGSDLATASRYDIVAKAEGEGTLARDRAMQMLQTLLADRFQLKVHRETRDTPVYELVVGKNGPKKLKEVAADAKEEEGNATGGFTTGRMHTETAKGTMDQLARMISLTAGRPVIDKTGLTGFYKYTLDWLSANRPPEPDSDLPSMFTAVQEQLGLKLESTKAPVEMLIVDHAERPSEN